MTDKSHIQISKNSLNSKKQRPFIYITGQIKHIKIWDSRRLGSLGLGNLWDYPDKLPVAELNGYNEISNLFTINNDVPKGYLYVRKDLSKPAIDYIRIWDNAGAFGGKTISMWRPIPPEHYIALSDVLVLGLNKPDNNLVKCVHEDYVISKTSVQKAIWTSEGSFSEQKLKIWKTSEYNFFTSFGSKRACMMKNLDFYEFKPGQIKVFNIIKKKKIPKKVLPAIGQVSLLDRVINWIVSIF